MKTTLLLGFILFLTACSDRPANRLATHADDASGKEAVSADGASSVQQTETTETAQKSAVPAQKTVESNTSEKAETAINGHALFVQKCASCHGHNAEKSALNNSQIIAGWDKERVVKALTGYQDGTYGSNMKGIMKGQTASLNAEQIEALADYIATR
jgi:cytochrome c553